MELGFFLLELLPPVDANALREEAWSLCYLTEGGFSYTEVQGMTRGERTWFLKRLARQKESEADAIKAAKGKR